MKSPLPMNYYALVQSFWNLHRALQWYCHALCKILKRMGNGMNVIDKRNFARFLFKEAFRTDTPYCTTPQADFEYCNRSSAGQGPECGCCRLILYNDVIMSAMASQITSLTNVYSTVYSGADRWKLQSSTSRAFVGGIHWWPVNSL